MKKFSLERMYWLLEGILTILGLILGGVFGGRTSLFLGFMFALLGAWVFPVLGACGFLILLLVASKIEEKFKC